jgi:hypothetical protein
MSEILSEDEEAALALVRRALEEARAGGATAYLRGLSAAIAAAGACTTVETRDSVSFAHRSARFTVRAFAERPGSFELSFQEAEP